MTDTCIKPKKNTGALIGIIAVFTVAGLCAGFAGGQLTTRAQATKEVENIRLSYDESQKVRAEALRMCLQLAPKAADTAAAAASAAGDAAAAAQRALEQSTPGKDAKPMDTPK